MATDDRSYTNVVVSDSGPSEKKIEAEIPAHRIEQKRHKAIKTLNDKIKLDGFREGHIPEAILAQHIGDIGIWEEMAEHALRDIYPALVTDHALDVIGTPSISITKIAPGNPLGFVATTAVMPDIELPDYATIASKINKKKEPVTATDADVETALLQIRRARAHNEALQKGEKIDAQTLEEKDLPPLDIPYLQSIGDFASIEAFAEKLKEQIQAEKESEAQEKTRMEISESIIEKITTPIPNILIQAELDRMIGRLKFDIEQMGFEFEKYLQEIDKSEDNVRDEWKDDAKKRAILQLALSKIAGRESLLIDPEKLETEVQRALAQKKDADEKTVRAYLTMALLNERVFEFLETL